MKWTVDAEAAIKKVPFFVRKRVRARVENEAVAAGKQIVSLAQVKATQARFLSKMDSEIKGYQLEGCFGPGGCPNRANPGEQLLERLEALLQKENLLEFLREQVKGDLKFHHEFRITLADCPNSCSQPQIKDIGIIGASSPHLSQEPCTRCNACVAVCKEDAIQIDEDEGRPEIDFDKCLYCGQCIAICPTATITTDRKGYRVQLGGKLGRHPRLARELPGIFSEDDVVAIVEDCIDFYKRNSRNGKRFAEILTPAAFESRRNRYGRRTVDG
ncbi:MAG: 4Fe-4S dicluster domain-containing protein [Desulfobacterales bacterium]|nr:4Fe-4S dicluster domain-containing protein [Desulfobacterales bacterium]